MKLSIVLSTQPASFDALAYKGHIEKNLEQISKFGYDGVELAVRDPNLLDIAELKSLLHKNRLPVSALGTGQAYGEEGLSFVDSQKQVRLKAIERIKSHIRLADQLGAIVIIGLIRGKKCTSVNEEVANNWLIEALTECASENDSIKLVIEPINRYETNLINTVDSGLRLLEKIDKHNVGLLLDTFHMNIEEPSIIESIVSAKDHIFHFHVADSNRWYPGAGHVNFSEIMEALDQCNYQGFVSAEIMPLPNPDTAAQKTIENMKLFLK